MGGLVIRLAAVASQICEILRKFEQQQLNEWRETCQW